MSLWLGLWLGVRVRELGFRVGVAMGSYGLGLGLGNSEFRAGIAMGGYMLRFILLLPIHGRRWHPHWGGVGL